MSPAAQSLPTYAKAAHDNKSANGSWEWNPTKWTQVPTIGVSVNGNFDGSGGLVTAVPTLTPTGSNTALPIGTISPEGGWNIDFNVGTGKNEEPGFGQGLVDGFEGGIDSTVDFFKSLGTVQGWKDIGNGFVNLSKMMTPLSIEGAIMKDQLAYSVVNYVENIPNMSAYEMGYDLGFGLEKGVEIALTRRVAWSFKVYPNAKGFGFDFKTIRFDAHKFRLGGRKTGYDVWRPHIDIPSRRIKHWPWHQLDKWKRGVK